MQNEQEVLINRLSQYSMGARFVFAPDEYRKGNSTREPADIVWACEDCTIIMYMVDAKPSSSHGKNTKRRNKAITHNLKQAGGWLREWRNGRPIVGNNNYTSYSLEYEKSKHIIVLSIVAGADPVALYHHAEEKKLSVSLCATIPQMTLEKMFEIGGTAIDLILYISCLKDQVGHVTQEKTLTNLAIDQRAILQLVDRDSRWFSRGISESLALIQPVLHQLREPGPKPTQKSSDLTCIGRILNDMPLIDWLRIIVALMERTEDIEPEWKKYAVQRLSLTYYDFIIVVSDFSFSNQASKEALKMAKAEQGKDRLAVILCWWRPMPGARSSTTFIMSDDRPRFTTVWLDNMAEVAGTVRE